MSCRPPFLFQKKIKNFFLFLFVFLWLDKQAWGQDLEIIKINMPLVAVVLVKLLDNSLKRFFR